MGGLDLKRVPDASGMFNLMRNLGGAIGLALIDTVIYSRSTLHGNDIVRKLMAGDVPTARFVGIPLDRFVAEGPGPIDVVRQALLQPLVEKAGLTLAINDAWMMIAALTMTVLFLIPFARRAKGPQV